MTKKELDYILENYSAEQIAQASILAHQAWCEGLIE